MKSHYRSKAKYCTSSSSGQPETIRGYVDVVDSSDERFIESNPWRGGMAAGNKVAAGGGRKVIKQQRDFPEDYYDLPPMDDDANEQMRAGDFKLMTQLPTSVGGHFKFSSEKQWEEQAENDTILEGTEASEYFTLNLKLINLGLQTIPFYKRMDYSAAMFSNEQIVNMEKKAEEAEKAYQLALKEHIENPRIQINSASRKTNSARSQKPAAAANAGPDELDELLNMTANVDIKSGAQTPRTVASPGSQTVPATAGATTDNKDDIQQWLDNVLDE